MKIILPFLIALPCLLSCYHVEPIHKLSQLEPALRKYVGEPSEIDTSYKELELFQSFSDISFIYENATEGTFEKLVSFLSEAYDCEPVWEISSKRKRATLVPIPQKEGFYMVQTSEWIEGKENKREIILVVLDVNNELVPPSTSKSDSIPSSN